MTRERALVIGPAWVGDMVIAHSLFQVLKARTPECALDVVAPAATAPLAQRMPEIDEAITLPVAHGRLALLPRISLGLHLRERHYERAYVLPRSWKAALPAWLSGAKRRTGFLGEARFGLINDVRSEPRGVKLRTVDRFLRLAEEPGVPKREAPVPHLLRDLDHGRRTLSRLGASADGAPILVLCPGAEYGPAKRWPARHFATLARRYHARGWQVWLLGSARDRAIADAIRADAPDRCLDFIGHTTLLEALDLLAFARAVVTNDSGLMHVAAALGVPVVAVFGSSDPRHTPPLSARAEVLWRHLDCSPCFARTCRFGHLRCLEEITPGHVEEALERLLTAD